MNRSRLRTDPAERPVHRHRRRILKSIVGGSIGNLVEWYDWYVYSAFSLYFAKAFFPSGDRTTQLLNTAAIFAVGFLVRPIGGWLFGVYADRRGRKAALTASVLLMCLGSLLIALTPSRDQIGIAAPVLLVLARLLQGLSVGGEYGTSATYLSELAPQAQRGFYSSFQYVTLILGQLLALAVLLFLQRCMSNESLTASGWRVPFVIGAACALVGLYLRRGIDETPAFEASRDTAPPKNLLRELLHYPRELLTVVGLTLGGTVGFYTYTTYMQKFLVNTVGLQIDDATLLSAGTLFLFICLQPVVGALSDRVGRRPVLISFGVLGSLFTVPILTLLSRTTSAWDAFLLLMGALVIVSGYTAISAIVKAELFPAQIRALGVGLPFALTVSLFGGTAEYVALWLKSIGQEPLFYWYVSACIAVSLAVYTLMPEPQRHSRIDTEPPERA